MVEAKARRSTLASRPFCTAVARIIISRARKLWSYQAATLTGDNMEALHQMRVASRRLRAAFDACQPCLPPREYRRLRQTIGAVTDQLGAVRDCDVMLDFLRRERAQALTEEQAGLDDLIQQVTARRDAAWPELVAFLRQLEADAFPKCLRQVMRDSR